MAMGNNYQKQPDTAYVNVKKLGIAQTTPLKFGFGMLIEKIPTIVPF